MYQNPLSPFGGRGIRVRGDIRMTRRTVRRARRLRRNQTPGEIEMWRILRNRQFSGAKFRRQHPIGPYIVDFFCAEHDLVIEVDGDSHAYKVKRDQDRSDWLSNQGYRIIRFTETEIQNQREDVLNEVWEVMQKTKA
jgi:very-short-patch-repair endonuclease